MAEKETGALKGIDIVFKYRNLKDQATDDAWTIPYTTENSLEMSGDSESTPTKDGAIVTPGAIETTASATAYYKIGSESLKKTKAAFKAHERIELWSINTKEIGSEGKCQAEYFQGYITSFSETSSAEDLAEYEIEFALEDGKDGEVTFDEAEISKGYEFTDTEKVSAGA